MCALAFFVAVVFVLQILDLNEQTLTKSLLCVRHVRGRSCKIDMAAVLVQLHP